MHDGGSVRLTVISPEPIDEERFRAAAANWIEDEMAQYNTIVFERMDPEEEQ